MPPLTKKSSPLVPLMAPVVMVRVPLTPVRLTPLTPLVAVRLSIVPFTVPFARSSLRLVPVMVVLLMFNVPNAPLPLLEEMALLVTERPRMVLVPVAPLRVIAAPPAFSKTGLAVAAANVTPLRTRASFAPQSV